MSMTDTLKGLFDKILDLHREYSTMSANFQNLERQFERLLKSNERFTDNTVSKLDDLGRRITTLEGIVNATFANAMKEAMILVTREYVEKHGALPLFPADPPVANNEESRKPLTAI